jgi:hypothetical protein
MRLALLIPLASSCRRNADAYENKASTVLLLMGTALALAVGVQPLRAQISHHPLIPHATWDCGMPEGIPTPEAGRLVLEIEIPLERTVDVGRTQHGLRRVAVGLEGAVR